MSEVAFISDACTLPGYIAGSEGQYPALRFRYRPATVGQRAALLVKRHTRPKADAAAFVAEKLVSWELVGAELPTPLISPASLSALEPKLFRRLVLVVLGYESSDVDPCWPAELADEVRGDRTIAAEQFRPVGDIGQERREKN